MKDDDIEIRERSFDEIFGRHEADEEEILAMEISEDRRLREVGIDPDGDPIEIMIEVRKRALADKAEDAKRDAKKE